VPVFAGLGDISDDEDDMDKIWLWKKCEKFWKI
jgi:hypothetical protein